MKTEIIASWSITEYKSKSYYVITTISNQTIWVPKDKFDTNAETITYEALEVGAPYTNKAGEELKRTKAGNNFIGCGKQIVKKFSSIELMDHLVNKGITPQFNLS